MTSHQTLPTDTYSSVMHPVPIALPILKVNRCLCAHSTQRNLSVSGLPAAPYQTVLLTQGDFLPWIFQTWWAKKTEHSVLRETQGPNLYLVTKKIDFRFNSYVKYDNELQKILPHTDISETQENTVLKHGLGERPVLSGMERGQGGEESFPAIYKADGNTKRYISKRFGITCLRDL